MNVLRKEIETERLIGCRYVQFQSRAEALVPGAGREAIEPLLWDASSTIIRADVQPDRVVLDGQVSCQAIYRQGNENSLRALSAKSTISQVVEIPGASGEMLARVYAAVEGVEAKYENGHMVFMVSVGLHVLVLKLENHEIVTGIEDAPSLEKKSREICTTKLAAEANETAVLTERAKLPEALDARTTLMDWGSVSIDSAEPDLGGLRVKGRAMVESLIASGMEKQPAVLIRTPINFDKLIEIPEWLMRSACVVPTLRVVRSQIEPGESDDARMLSVQADVHFEIAANLRECADALEDVYACGAERLEVETQSFDACAAVQCTQTTENVRGVCMLHEDAPSAGEILCVRALPIIAEVSSQNGRSRIRGLISARLLYMTEAGIPTSALGEIPFEMDVPQVLDENSVIRICAAGAEAGSVMSDRVEVRVSLAAWCETRASETFTLVADVRSGEPVAQSSGYIVFWPGEGDDAWKIGKRYHIPLDVVSAEANGEIQSGRPLVLKS